MEQWLEDAFGDTGRRVIERTDFYRGLSIAKVVILFCGCVSPTSPAMFQVLVGGGPSPGVAGDYETESAARERHAVEVARLWHAGYRILPGREPS
jgi:hypothetical protein